MISVDPLHSLLLLLVVVVVTAVKSIPRQKDNLRAQFAIELHELTLEHFP